MRSGSRTNPSPLDELDCRSQSTSRTLTSAAARDAARLIAVVVFPTPPFWFAMAITLATSSALESRTYGSSQRLAMPEIGAGSWINGPFHVEQSRRIRFNVDDRLGSSTWKIM